jgi:integrase
VRSGVHFAPVSVSVQARGNRHQLRVKHRLLPRAFFFTFDTEVEARTYGEQLEALLARGVVPAELLASAPKGGADPLLVEVVRAYCKAAPLTDSDDALLGSMLDEIAGVRMAGVTFAWADGYVRRLKRRQLAPSTIRKRVGVLGRVIDWHLRMSTPAGQVPLANALRLLPPGYSVYSRIEAAELEAKGVDIPRDVERDRRLLPAEEARVRAALAGTKREDRERALAVDPELVMLFDLVLETGLRLREAYTLRVDQFDLARGVLAVEGTKGHRGVIKPRQVPLKPALVAKLQAYLRGRVGRIFSFWDGTPADLKPTTSRLSSRFRALFDYAQLPDFTEHDLRHEATCRWVELRSRDGRGWAFSDIEVCRIMGWRDPKMMLRYASLRAEDLAARLR